MKTAFTKSGKWKRWQVVLLSIALLLIGFLLFWPKTPQPPKSVANTAELEAYMEKLADFGTPPGMSFVVIKNSHIIYSKGFGWADRPRRIAATPETVYHWWSCTKIATAIAILQPRLHRSDSAHGTDRFGFRCGTSGSCLFERG